MSKTTKDKAIKRLDAIDKEIKSAQDEAAALRKIIEMSDSIKIEDLTYLNSCELLKKCVRTRDHYETDREWAQHQLERIIEAANFIDNDNKLYYPDFNNVNISKYLPYFKKQNGSWSLPYVVGDYHWDSCTPLGLYYKSANSAETIVSKYMSLYSIILG